MPFLQSIRTSGQSAEQEGYPFSLPAVAALEQSLEIDPKVTFLVGENGSGKSTVLEAIADKWGFSRESGNRVRGIQSAQCDTALGAALTLTRGVRRPKGGFFLRAESFFNFATELDELEKQPFCATGYAAYGGKSLHQQSHGESFLALFRNRFAGSGLFLLDEPEAALSPARQMAFLVRLHDLVGEESQFVIATHSPIILGYPGARIYECSEDGIREVAYEETAAYQLTKRFVLEREHVLRQLFAEEE